jgi:Zn-dependent protease
MGWSFRIARVAGIDIKVHVTFFLILIWGAAQWARFGATGYLFGAGLMLLLFLCVTLHELGHSVVAQRFGITVRQIILLPIGGVALLGRIPQNPWQELAIAVAGPAVNVVIAAALALGMGINNALGRVSFEQIRLAAQRGPSRELLLLILLSSNIGLVLFNMIPAFPLDGGRVLRSLLAMRMPWHRATNTAATIGRVMAMLLGLFGLF